MEPERQSSVDLKSQVLARIEKESVCPHSRLFFGSRECGVWALWFLTVLFGALSVAVTLFVVTFQQYSLYEATHESFLAFAVDVLPYLWILLFAVMVLFAVYNLRHTKNGYRYPLWKIIGSSLVLSLAGGSLLHLAGVGFSFDKQMGVFSKDYPSQEKLELKMWQNPQEGRLVGTLLSAEDGIPQPLFVIEDQMGTRWNTDISELHEMDRFVLETGKRVRVLGLLEDVNPPAFHACAIFPWVYEHEYSRSELRDMKNMMKERIARHRLTDEPESVSKKCAKILPNRAF